MGKISGSFENSFIKCELTVDLAIIRVNVEILIRTSSDGWRKHEGYGYNILICICPPFIWKVFVIV